MGDAFKAESAPAFDINVKGTNKIAKIDILRQSEVIHTLQPSAETYTGKWTDPNPKGGEQYYYIRVLQTDGEIAWASPIWVQIGK